MSRMPQVTARELLRFLKDQALSKIASLAVT
jgi:hypothetical protein